MLGCLELTARVAPDLITKQVHQRFLYSKRLCKMQCTNYGKQLTWMANGRGARGDLFHGEPVEIAIFGSSTSEDAMLDQEQSWAQCLKRALGPGVHVDNYGRDNSYLGQAVEILKEFWRTGRRYHIALLQVTVGRDRQPAYPEDAFHYWGLWPSGGRPLVFPRMLKSRLEAQLKSEATLLALCEKVHDFFRPPPPRKHPRRNSRANRYLRAEGKVQLVYQPRPLTVEDQQYVLDETKRLIQVARQVADRVYLIAQPVAYDEHEHPGVARRWFSLYPIKGRHAYYDNRSVAEWIREETALMTQASNQANVPVIDVDNYLRPMLATRDDLFDDKWHYAPAGAELAARFVAESIRRSEPSRGH